MWALIAALLIAAPGQGTILVGSFPERTWTDASGKLTFNAALILDARGLVLRFPDGNEHKFSPVDVSQPDQEYISKCANSLIPKRPVPPKRAVIRSRPRPAAATKDVDEYAYKNFGQEVANITANMRGVTQTRQEREDLKSLDFMLRDYNKHVAAKNWRQADLVRDKMDVVLSRGGAVAADAGRRVAAQERADEERRHEEEMRQRERHHRERMQQQPIIIRGW